MTREEPTSLAEAWEAGYQARIEDMARETVTPNPFEGEAPCAS